MNCFDKGRYLTRDLLDATAKSLETIENLCESPIERQFGIAAAVIFEEAGLRIVPQYKLSRYRYDFAIVHPGLDRVLMLVECDGKAFHSTPEQRENDRQKDAAAAEIGVFVARYTGKEITIDPRYCAENALGRLRKAWR